MTYLCSIKPPLTEKTTVAITRRLPYCQPFPGLQAGCFGVAVLLCGQSLAQQAPDTQMPQAPKAPTVESMSRNTTPANTGLAYQQPELAGRLELNLQQADGQDNETEPRRDTGEAEVQLTLSIEQPWGTTTKLVGQLELNTQHFTEDAVSNRDENEDAEFSYDLERLYVQFDPSKSFRIRAGRMGIDDPMETIIDEDLDGVQVSFETGRLELELSRTREDWFEASTIERRDEITNTMGSVTFSPSKKNRWMPYVLHRSDELSDIEATWLGLQGIVQPSDSPIRYWVHGSMLDGEETDADQTTQELGGYLVDTGISWTAGGALQPTFTLGIAHATGGSRDERFRQSGLHSNDFALNGKNTFRYLGEVMDPELTNLQIITLGVGADLSKDWTADIALHHYQQVEADNDLRGSDVEFDPLGINEDLGIGADLVLAYEPNKRFDIKGTAGVFAPGDAFNEDQDTAWLARLELDYNF